MYTEHISENTPHNISFQSTCMQYLSHTYFSRTTHIYIHTYLFPTYIHSYIRRIHIFFVCIHSFIRTYIYIYIPTPLSQLLPSLSSRMIFFFTKHTYIRFRTSIYIHFPFLFSQIQNHVILYSFHVCVDGCSVSSLYMGFFTIYW